MAHRITICGIGDNEIEIADPDGRVRIPFSSPLIDRHRDDLRWYLEEFRGLRIGADADRARRIASDLCTIGSTLFDQVFGHDSCRPILERARAHGLEVLELVINGPSEALLAIPWELLFSTADQSYLAALGTSITRELATSRSVEGNRPRLPGPIRVLLIVSRPTGLGAIPFGTVAASLTTITLDRNSNVELSLLRPPTLSALKEALTTDIPFDVVHFDGHGDFPSIADLAGAGAQGHLFFEGPSAEPDPVSAQVFAETLAIQETPPWLTILNACKSARQGDEDPMSSVARRVLNVGGHAVIAMPYAVRVDTVDLLMRTAYRSLATGHSVSRALADGRAALVLHRTSSSTYADWFVPVLLTNTECPTLSGVGPRTRSFAVQGKVDLQRLVGRGRELHAMERLLWRQRVIVVHGLIGSGKSEFCLSLLTWIQLTTAATSGVFLDCRDFADAGAAIAAALGQGAGVAVSREDSQYHLVILDHAERIFQEWSNPQDLVRLAEEAGVYLVMSTCRPAQVVGLAVVEIGDLDNAEAGRRLSSTVHEDSWKHLVTEGVLEIMFGVGDYHSRSLDHLLGQCIPSPPAAFVAELRKQDLGDFPLMVTSVEETAYRQLSDSARRVLPILGAMGRQVTTNHLSILTNKGLKKDTWSALGETRISEADWRQALSEAASVGLCADVLASGPLFYLPPTFRQLLRRELSTTPMRRDQIEEAMIELYASLAVFWDLEDPGIRMSAGVEESGMVRAILNAVRFKRFRGGQAILKCLVLSLLTRDASSVTLTLTARVWQALGDGFETDSADKMSFYLTLRQIELGEAERTGDQATRRRIAQESLARLETFQSKEWDSWRSIMREALYESLAELGELGIASDIAPAVQVVERRDGGPLVSDHRKETASLSTNPDTKNNARSRDALAFEAVGNAARKRSDFKAAQDAYSAAVRLWTLIHRHDNAANARALVADVLVELGKTNEAIHIYREALTIQERTGQLLRAANTALMIGQAYEQQGEFAVAKQWCMSAVPMLKRLGNSIELGHVYHELAIIELRQSRYRESVDPLEQAVLMYHRARSDWHEADSLFMLGQAQVRLQDLPAARVSLERSRKLVRDPKNPHILVGRNLLLSSVLLHLKEAAAAVPPVVDVVQMTSQPRPEDVNSILSAIKSVIGGQDLQRLWDESGGVGDVNAHLVPPMGSDG